MPIYKVEQCGQFGIIDINDRRPYDIPPQSWDFLTNVRVINQSLQVVGGFSVNTNITNTKAHALDYYSSPAGDQHWYAYCDDDIISVDDGGVVQSVAKVGLATGNYPEKVWVTDRFNGIPIATNKTDAPQCFYDNGNPINAATKSQDFPNLPSPAPKAYIVVAYKNFIVMLNIDETNSYPNMVWWSSRAEPGLMPDSWDYTDNTRESRRRLLGDNSGAIVAAKVLRDDLFIYTEQATFKMTEIGGDLVMRITRVYSQFGAFGPRCVEDYGDKHFVITKSDVVSHDGNQWKSISDGRISRRLFAQVSEDDVNRIWVSPYRKRNEVHAGIPAPADNTLFSVLTWHWDDPEKPWALREYPDSRYMRELPVLETVIVTDTWDGGSDTTWDGGPDIIWNEGGALGDLTPIATSTDGNLYLVDTGQIPIDAIVRRTGINLGGDERLETIQSVVLRMQSDTPVTVTIGASATAEGTITWGTPASFDPSTDYRVTRMATGRRHAIQIEGNVFRLQGYDIEWVDAGEA